MFAMWSNEINNLSVYVDSLVLKVECCSVTLYNNTNKCRHPEKCYLRMSDKTKLPHLMIHHLLTGQVKGKNKLFHII